MSNVIDVEFTEVPKEEVKLPTGPRVTQEHIQSKIIGATFWQPEDTTLTVAAILLVNGTIVTGESACVSPENFDAEKGQEIAYKNAYEKIWALEGYLLKERLTRLPNGRAGDVIPEPENEAA